VSLHGDMHAASSDYPDVAWEVGGEVAHEHADRGILICGSGIGVCMAANKIHGVRAALVYDLHGAELSRRHNDANVLCLSSDETPLDEMQRIVDAWLTTPFDGGRHERRVNKMRAIEHGENPATVTRPAGV
jgi:ribose 5-phosphate isomerase B